MRREINGTTLGYDLTGSGEAVLFLHAFPLHRAMWEGQVAALRGRARTLTVDFRGFGESDVPPGPYRLEQFADDALGLAEALGIRRATVVGLSLGGYVAFRLVERAPEFARALVLADTRAEPDPPEAKTRRYALAERVEREGMAAMADFVAALLGPTSKAERPEVAARIPRIIGAPDPRAVAETLRALGERPDSRSVLSRITVPTLVLVGEEDTLTPPDGARVIAGGVPGARLEILPRSGHLSNLEAAEAFNRELVTFLEGLPAGG
ncbi:MAG TPA: alpha/beta fold hydrolase [bacterium]|jgi:pimeloyl-ACP methyl ester carboxylesterase|nr:alpha/beta fold hydrolase [bacterium]